MKEKLKIIYEKLKIAYGILECREWLVFMGDSKCIVCGCHMKEKTFLKAERMLEELKWEDNPENWK